MNIKKRRFLMRLSILSILAVVLGYVFYTNFISDEQTAVTEGETAPNFQLTNMDGEQVQLEDYRGKGVFLNFWGTYCPPCEKEMPYMESQHQAFEDRGVEVLAVNVAETELVVSRFSDRHQLSFPIVLDRNRNVVDSYGIGPLPSTFLIDENGVVQDIITGSMTEETIREYMEQIEPA